MRPHQFYILLAGVTLIGGLISFRQANSSFVSMWFTSAQQYQRLANQEKYEAAAERAVDPMQKATALYQAAKFEEAAAVFGAISRPEALYNRGNTFVMLGQYDAAIASYEKALQQRPGWPEATGNMELAKLRKERMAAPEDDHSGTGGKLAADEIVISDKEMSTSSPSPDRNGQQQELTKNEQLELWLNKVQTKPADFLRLKFSYQLSRQEQ